jgi:hypothetical protein
MGAGRRKLGVHALLSLPRARGAATGHDDAGAPRSVFRRGPQPDSRAGRYFT